MVSDAESKKKNKCTHANHHLFLLEHSRYNCLDDWTKKMFSSSVNITDEALVMLVVKHYIPKWELSCNKSIGGTSVAEDSMSRGSAEEGDRKAVGKRLSGAVKGDDGTCIKQKACYYEYCQLVQQVRQSNYRDAWDQKLKDAALDHLRDQEEKAKSRVENGSIASGVGGGNSGNNAREEGGSNLIFMYGVYDDDEVGLIEGL